MSIIEFRGSPRPLLTEAQIRALAYSGFEKPLSAPVKEIHLSTGLPAGKVRHLRNALENRGLVDRSGAMTELGYAVLTEYRPAHVVRLDLNSLGGK